MVFSCPGFFIEFTGGLSCQLYDHTAKGGIFKLYSLFMLKKRK